MNFNMFFSFSRPFFLIFVHAFQSQHIHTWKHTYYENSPKLIFSHNNYRNDSEQYRDYETVFIIPGPSQIKNRKKFYILNIYRVFVFFCFNMFVCYLSCFFVEYFILFNFFENVVQSKLDIWFVWINMSSVRNFSIYFYILFISYFCRFCQWMIPMFIGFLFCIEFIFIWDLDLCTSSLDVEHSFRYLHPSINYHPLLYNNFFCFSFLQIFNRMHSCAACKHKRFLFQDQLN